MNDNQKETALEPIVVPAVTPQQAKDAWKAYQELKKTVQTKEDVQLIEGKEFLKKSYWRKIATFFNLSVDYVREEKEELPNGDVAFHFVCKAIAPNGRFAIGAGSCNRMEKNRVNSIHNTRATAETRAWNRAISNLVGGGEVSYEEVVANGHEEIPINLKNGKCRYCGTQGKFHKKGCPGAGIETKARQLTNEDIEKFDQELRGELRREEI